MNKLCALPCGVLMALLVSAPGCGKQDTPKPIAAAEKKVDGAKPPEIDPDLKKQILEPEAKPELKIPPVPLTPEEKKAVVTPKLPIIAPKDRAKPTETVALTAAAFATEIGKNVNDAAKKFESVYVELTGVVRFVGSRDREAFVTLDAGPESLGIKCMLAKETEPWAKISKGSKVKVRGEWPDSFDQPRLDKCELIETGPNPAQELSAEALADEFAKNKDAARAKYQEKTVIVTGVVLQRERNEQNAVRLFLKGAGDTRVDCGFDAPDRVEAETPGIGGAVRVVGEFSSFESSNGPALRGCRLITRKN